MKETAKHRPGRPDPLRNARSYQPAAGASTKNAHHRTMNFGRLVAGFPAFFVFISLMLGGSATFGLWSNMALELISIAFLLAVVFTSRDAVWLSSGLDLLALLALITVIAVLHLVPLPASIWSALPGRSFVVEGYRLLGAELPALPLSLEPMRARESALSIFPIVCAVLLVLRAGKAGHIPLAIVTAATAILSVVLGITQMLSGDTGLYPYSKEPMKVAAGFFANQNHLASLILISLPLITALYLEVEDHEHPSSRRAQFFMFAAVVVFLAAGAFIVASVAGVLLLIPTLFLSGGMLFLSNSKKRLLPITLGAAGMIGASSALVLTSENARSLETSLGSDELDRLGIARTSVELVRDYWPAGSGLSSFEAVYKVREDLETVSGVYVNHAHNEYLELLIETGLLGLLLIVLLALYWAKWTHRAWTDRAGDGHWRQAASISILIVALHSFLDYPARTLGILVLLSSCFAMLRYTPEKRP